MAYTTPRTWMAGETVTAALMNTHLRDNLTAIVAANPLVVPAARVYNNADQSIPNNSATALTFNSETFDTDTIHDTSTNTGRLTCKTAGIYEISASVAFAAHSTGTRALYFYLNGATTIAQVRLRATPDGRTMLNLNTQYSLSVNDYIELYAYQNSSGALSVNADDRFGCEFMMTYLGKVA